MQLRSASPDYRGRVWRQSMCVLLAIVVLAVGVVIGTRILPAMPAMASPLPGGATAQLPITPFVPGSQLGQTPEVDESEAVNRAQRSAARGETREPTRAERLLWLELQIDWTDSTAVGLPYDGELIDGVQLPVEGQNFFTWDAVNNQLHNPDDRRWGTNNLLLTILAVLDEYRAANPGAPRVGISDLSRPEGGSFGAVYGGLGHSSHQNGLDVDIAYPRRDGQELGITDVDEIDHELSQDLIDRFVDAGAQFVFVGENTDLVGPSGVVKPWPHHDDHLHLRILPE